MRVAISAEFSREERHRRRLDKVRKLDERKWAAIALRPT